LADICNAAKRQRRGIGISNLEARDTRLLQIDLKVPPTVDQLLLRGHRAAEMPAHEPKDCIAGLLAAVGVDRAAVPAV